jgi:hypothetical protein
VVDRTEAAHVVSGEAILGWVSLVGTLVLGLLAARNAWRSSRSGEKQVTVEEKKAQFGANLELNKYIDGRVDALVEERIGDLRSELLELKRLDRTRVAAMTRILRAIANQWPAGFSGPHLDPADIAAIEETIPEQWLRPLT